MTRSLDTAQQTQKSLPEKLAVISAFLVWRGVAEERWLGIDLARVASIEALTKHSDSGFASLPETLIAQLQNESPDNGFDEFKTVPHWRCFSLSEPCEGAKLWIYCKPQREALMQGQQMLACVTLSADKALLEANLKPGAQMLDENGDANNQLPGDLMLLGLMAVKQRELDGKYWFASGYNRRSILLHFDGMSVLLEQGTSLPVAVPLLPEGSYFICLEGDDSKLLSEDLRALQTIIMAGELPERVILPKAEEGKTRCVVIAPSSEALSAELNALIQAVENQRSVRTPAGSVWLTETFSEDSLCNVFPGVGNGWPGQFEGLHRWFPTLYADADQRGDLRELMTMAAEPKLTDLAINGVCSGWLLAKLLTEQLEITPATAFGYSLGEVSMWAGLGFWQSPWQLAPRMKASVAFNRGITGELEGIKALWQGKQESESEACSKQQPDWTSYSVKVDSRFRDKQPSYEKTWLAIDHGHSGILVGDPAQCKALIAELKLRPLKVDFVTAMHTPAAAFYGEEIGQLFNLTPSQLQIKTRCFSSANYGQVQPEREQVATSISRGFCQPLDFSRLTEQVYQQGARLFIETGSGRSCCTLIDKILADRPHLCVPVISKGRAVNQTIISLLGQLMAAGIPIRTSWRRVLVPGWQE